MSEGKIMKIMNGENDGGSAQNQHISEDATTQPLLGAEDRDDREALSHISPHKVTRRPAPIGSLSHSLYVTLNPHATRDGRKGRKTRGVLQSIHLIALLTGLFCSVPFIGLS